jgi:hypothetical protein
MYGLETDAKRKLGQWSRCPEVLKEAGYDVEIENPDSKEKQK